MVHDIEKMTYEEYSKICPQCVPTRSEFSRILNLVKYEPLFEEYEGYSGCENTASRKQFFSDEFINCKYCIDAKNTNMLLERCNGCKNHWLEIPPEGKKVGINFEIRPDLKINEIIEKKRQKQLENKNVTIQHNTINIIGVIPEKIREMLLQIKNKGGQDGI